MSSRNHRVLCKRCKSSRTMRVSRTSFFQNVILRRLGFHPWQCRDCMHSFYSRHRGSKNNRRKGEPQETFGFHPEQH